MKIRLEKSIESGTVKYNLAVEVDDTQLGPNLTNVPQSLLDARLAKFAHDNLEKLEAGIPAPAE